MEAPGEEITMAGALRPPSLFLYPDVTPALACDLLGKSHASVANERSLRAKQSPIK